MFDEFFLDSLVSTVNMKNTYIAKLKYVCNYFTSISPQDKYVWYFNPGGFILVDVPFDFVDDYISFIEDVVDCRYTTDYNLNGVTFIISLSTLLECLKNM
jgi:hypothetical protein